MTIGSTMFAGWRGMASITLVGMAAALLLGCPNKPEEPDPTSKKPSDAATSPAPTPSPSAPNGMGVAPVPSSGDAGVNLPLTVKEKREMHEKLHNELCELAAKHQNVVYGRPELDKKGSLLITGCLFEGNTAWYKCIISTTTPKDFEWCSERYMRPESDIK